MVELFEGVEDPIEVFDSLMPIPTWALLFDGLQSPKNKVDRAR